MKLTTKLAFRHLRQNRRQASFTFIAAGLATAMLVGLGGIAYSFYRAFLLYSEATGRVNSGSMSQISSVLFAVVPFLAAIIVFGAVIVISNAFSISASERVRQFGILKSVGGTKKQIRQSVLSEACLVSVIAVPLGVAAGFLATIIGMALLNHYLGGHDVVNDPGTGIRIVFRAAFHLPVLFASCALSFVTIILSTYRVARKVGRLSAIDAIRQTGEITVKPGDVRTHPLVGRLFGFEGTLAAKSLKRSKRQYRATVVSLVISIVLVIVGANFGQLLYSTADAIRPEVAGNVRVMIINEDYEAVQNLLQAYGNVEITPEFADYHANFYCQVENPEDFRKYAEREIALIIMEQTHINVVNLESHQHQVHQIYTMLMIFIYCFAGMLTAIGITSVLATINSNIALRKSEFAVLQSVGMDKRGLRRMLNLESLMYGVKSLLMGVPLGLVLSYVMYLIVVQGVPFAFAPSWPSVLFCAVGVFAVTLVSMRYASGKLRRGSIIEAIRGGEGQ
jgi:ABC-type lipoprotein release transport system permease subunit